MKTSKKGKTIFIGLLALTVLSTSSLLLYNHLKPTPEPKPLKVIGTQDLRASSLPEWPSDTIEDLLRGSDTVIYGTVEEIELVQEVLFHPSTDLKVSESYYRIAVTDFLCGKEKEKVVVCMIGTPDTGMTKPKVGEKVVMFLGENESGVFAVKGYEDGVFRVFEDGTVESFSNEKELAKYDGKSLNVLIDDIKKAVNKKDSEKQ
jgi:hypothetical protein